MPQAITQPGSSLTRGEAEDFLYFEARLLDERRYDEWLQLFAADGLYWIPLDESQPRQHSTSIIYDPPLRREERVHHLMHTRFPAQSPPSRTMHMISNIEIETPGEEIRLLSNQVTYEIRTGDFRQAGLGELRTICARVEHLLRREQGALKILRKKLSLIDRDMALGNLTFLL